MSGIVIDDRDPRDGEPRDQRLARLRAQVESNAGAACHCRDKVLQAISLGDYGEALRFSRNAEGHAEAADAFCRLLLTSDRSCDDAQIVRVQRDAAHAAARFARRSVEAFESLRRNRGGVA